MLLSKNIIFLRKKNRLTQAQLGEVLGITGSQITNYEKDKSYPTVDVVMKIGNYFKIGLDDLFYKDIETDGFSESDLSLDLKSEFNLSKKDAPSISDRLNFIEKEIAVIKRRLGE
jgi:transcriptional regulator with XRE-family HTH domain